MPFVITALLQSTEAATVATWHGLLDALQSNAATVCLFAVTCTAWQIPHPRLMLAAQMLSTTIKLADMPRIWDGTWWLILWGVPFVCVLLTRPVTTQPQRDAAAHEIFSALRPMCHLLYTAAAVWKVNWDFIDPTQSCAPIFGAQLLARLPKSWNVDSHELAYWIVRGFPLMTVCLELGVPVLMTAVGPLSGIALGLALHLGIAITPAPNNAGGFSVVAALFYFAFLPNEMAQALSELRSVPPQAWAVGTAALAASVYHSGVTTCFAAGFVYFIQLGVFSRAAALRLHLHAKIPVKQTKEAEFVDSAPAKGLALYLGVSFTFYYAFVTAMLGTWDMGIDHPYSNLRLHSGASNHLVLPTGILHRVPMFAEDTKATFPWSGGPVLVLNSTSDYFQTQGGVPGEVSDLDDRAIAMLEKAGHSGRQFFSVAKRFSPWSPRNSNATELKEFVPFTVPAFELRRLISEGTLGADSQLVYARGGGLLPSRRTVVTVTTDSGGKVSSCSAGGAGSQEPRPCTGDELALLPPLPGWLMTIAPVYNAYPLVDGDVGENPAGRQQLMCYG